MSSFSTNRATRRSKRAKTNLSTFQNVLSNGGPSESDGFALNHGISSSLRKPQKRYTVLGDQDSKGLTIIGGGTGRDWSDPSNPDEKTIALSRNGEDANGDPEDRLYEAVYPIGYQGPGHMRFVSPVAIPTLRGDTEVKGTLTAETLAGPLASTYTPLPTVQIEDTSGNAFTSIAVAGGYTNIGGYAFISVNLGWLTIGSATGEIVVTGLPAADLTFPVRLPVKNISGISSTHVGGELYIENTLGGFELFETDPNSTEPGTPLEQTNFDAVGEIHIHGFYKLT